MLYLEDLNVGDRFISREYEMTLEEIKQFAGQYDPQPFHLDEAEAEKSLIFQGLAASGWHTAAVTMRLWTECFPIQGGLIGSESSLRWPRPTRPGDKIHVEVEVTAIVPSKTKNDRGIVSYITQALNQNGDVLLISTTKIVVFRKNV
ncbi:MAG TPA: dehydratase [Acinetobacter ursingii]|uniref:Dehydratase n=1 Tax=Acinetobacter ursingii TaxID=108980 RepID=A0A3D2SP81_9GAMM|nr:MaoC family dehydratase [Acinetobacter ursingii]MCH2005146.1 MaoC family dehydratase [Acinetobacter ursingii]MCU4304606.1 MaoC family dehydratase [Acinetobacter ursingii]MCU4370611.1 MaoC family dehydratase [Acinetobacter ursingii]MCU4380140.1 MaoC family dehydratase [Acinetobacter ursingii]MCU4609225.1 MaoC family dehydratase [Acinetobacter ursingii]